jgi:hypothetical protein
MYIGEGGGYFWALRQPKGTRHNWVRVWGGEGGGSPVMITGLYTDHWFREMGISGLNFQLQIK